MTPTQSRLPFLGTWKLTGCEASHPELVHPKAGLTTFAQRENGLDYQSRTAWSDGRETVVTAVFQTDGTWCPVAGSALGDEVSLRLMEDGSAEGRIRRGGVDTGKNHVTVSPDGQWMTTQWDVTLPGGVAVTWKTTSQRQ